MEDIVWKFLDKSASEEERELLLRWLEEREDNKQSFREAYDIWLQSNASFTDDEDMEAALSRLKKRITSRTTPRLYLMRVAASILLLLSSGFAGYMLRAWLVPQAVAYNHLLTGADGKGQYTLPDGSTVWLNANTVLKYPETFRGESRSVQLEGEALFEVKKDKRKPFMVATDGMDVEMTGTRFLVTNYPHKNEIEAVLINGSVSINADFLAAPRALKPGQLMSYNKQSGTLDFQAVNTDDYSNWIHSKLVFDKTNLAHVIINLEKWFDVEIEASPDLIQSTHMSFTVRRESLEEVLKYMALTSPISYKWENDVLHLYPK